MKKKTKRRIKKAHNNQTIIPRARLMEGGLTNILDFMPYSLFKEPYEIALKPRILSKEEESTIKNKFNLIMREAGLAE